MEPLDDVIARLRAGKEELRRRRRQMSLPEKVREVILLQQATYPLLKRHRKPRSWEKPWPLDDDAD